MNSVWKRWVSLNKQDPYLWTVFGKETQKWKAKQINSIVESWKKGSKERRMR